MFYISLSLVICDLKSILAYLPYFYFEGTNYNYDHFPELKGRFLVSIQASTSLPNSLPKVPIMLKPLCTGVIVNESIVITSAQCAFEAEEFIGISEE